MKSILRKMVRMARSNGAYTLIELLVVIVIIAILAGIVLGVFGYVGTKLGRGRAVRDLEQIKNALAEYHATYGIFPPVNSHNVHHTPTMDWEHRNSDPWAEPPDRHYTTGLVWYLTQDTQAARWAHFIEGVVPNSGDSPIYTNHTAAGYVMWTNSLATCVDPWDQRYGYECYEPYQSYRLWSSGPTSVTNDDIGVTWNE